VNFSEHLLFGLLVGSALLFRELLPVILCFHSPVHLASQKPANPGNEIFLRKSHSPLVFQTEEAAGLELDEQRNVAHVQIAATGHVHAPEGLNGGGRVVDDLPAHVFQRVVAVLPEENLLVTNLPVVRLEHLEALHDGA